KRVGVLFVRGLVRGPGVAVQSGDQRSELDHGDGALADPALHAAPDAVADLGRDAPGLAARPRLHADDRLRDRHGVVLLEDLPDRHSDVWKEADVPGDLEVDA